LNAVDGQAVDDHRAAHTQLLHMATDVRDAAAGKPACCGHPFGSGRKSAADGALQ
jgi:hypothetical protein